MARTVGIGLSISSDTKVYNASFCPIALPAQLDPTIKFAEWHVTLPCGARAGVFRLSFAGLEPRRTPFFCEKKILATKAKRVLSLLYIFGAQRGFERWDVVNRRATQAAPAEEPLA